MAAYIKLPVDSIVVTEKGILRPKTRKPTDEQVVQLVLNNKQAFAAPADTCIVIENKWTYIGEAPIGLAPKMDLVEFYNPELRSEELAWCLGFLDGNYDYHSICERISLYRLEKRAISLYRCIKILNSRKIDVTFTATNNLNKSYEELIESIEEKTKFSYAHKLIHADIYNLAAYLAGYFDSNGIAGKDRIYIETTGEEKTRYLQKLFRIIDMDSAIFVNTYGEYNLNLWNIDRENNFIKTFINCSVLLRNVGLSLATKKFKTNVVNRVNTIQPCLVYEFPDEDETMIRIVSIDGVKTRLVLKPSVLSI